MESHSYYFEKAAEQARHAKCYRAKCGSIIVSTGGQIIGSGYNAPPLNDESQRYCNAEFNLTDKPKYDKTCCVHAEWNAIINCLKENANKIKGSTLYFMRVDENGNWTDAGQPFCTVCSRLAMEAGVAYFALWVNNEPKIYPTDEYNKVTYSKYQINLKKSK